MTSLSRTQHSQTRGHPIMQKTDYITEFNELSSHIHHANDGMSANLFSMPDAPEFNNTEYFLFSELYNIYDEQYFDITSPYTETFDAMTKYVLNNTGAYNQTKHALFDAHVKSAYGNPAFEHVCDVRLTRLAAWAITKQYNKLLFAQLFFMTPNAKFEDLYCETYKFLRIYWRNIMTDYDKMLNGAIKTAGGNFQETNRLAHRAFYYGLPSGTIKEAYNIPERPRDALANYMRTDSLIARTNAIKKTLHKFGKSKNKNDKTLQDILYTEMTNARVNMLQTGCVAPEKDISQTSVCKLRAELKKLETSFIDQNITRHL